MEEFVHLHVHTYYSILDGQSSIQRLVDKAVADGMRGMAITDHGNMFGIKEFYNYVQKVNGQLKAEGKPLFKPILGCEMYVARFGKDSKTKERADRGGNHLIVLAKNYQGYKNLIKLVSRAWVDGFYGRPRTDHADLETYHEGLIVCSACIAGEVPSKILKGDMEGARKSLEFYKRVFGDDFYLELQRHEVKDPTVMANRETFPKQQIANAAMIELAQEYGVNLVCTNDAHFVDEENAEAHDHLLCLSTGKDLNDPHRLLYTKQEWFKTQAEMNEVFGDLPIAMQNTVKILDKIEHYSIDHAPIMPFFPIPESFGTEEELRKSVTKEDLRKEFTSDENGENQLPEDEATKKIEKLGGLDRLYRIKLEADYLAKLAYDGAQELYPTPLSEEVEERIKFELHIMKTMGFPGYFLIVQDFINSARKELDVMVGPGRGSAAGSVVAYCLGITQIDPMKYDLLFERFLNPDRISLPDIDTDFDDDGRGRVLEWVEDKYGHEKVAHIITYGTMATKNSIKDIARVEGLPLDISNRLCKAIPDKLPENAKMNLTNAIKYCPELKEAEVSPNPHLRNTMKYARMLEGTVRGTGIHACGTIICRDDISDWVPVSTAEDKANPGHKLLCTQYDGHVIEETGLIKMDFLGLKTLSILKEAVENVKVSKGETVNVEKIPLDDELTYKLYCEGKTVGTFQFESSGMQKYLRELHPTVFEDLIAMNALYRPGPMDYIPEFIARKRDPSRIQYDIPCMEKYLKDTYGITVYQEQVMLLSRQLGNFTRGESDALRKAMGKKKKDILDKMKTKFLEGGIQNGHDAKILDKIWSDWEKFASYAFNKSHATCYSWLAYQTAYMKAHYPAEYMAAVMSRNLANITEITKLMDECKSMGIQTLGPDINESRLKFSVNSQGAIRFGMAAIKGVGEGVAQAVVEAREQGGPYKDIYDFFERVSLAVVNKRSIENIIISGGFDSFGLSRETFFGVDNSGSTFVERLVRYGQLYQQEKSNAINSLFGDEGAVEIAKPQPYQAAEWGTLERLNREKNLIGIYLSAHPLDSYKLVMNSMCNTHCIELDQWDELSQREELTFGGMITTSLSKYNQRGLPYGIITIEDYHGAGTITLFGDEWVKWENYLRKEGMLVFIRGKCVQRFQNSDRFDIRISSIEFLEVVKDRFVESFTICVDSNDIDEEIVTDLVAMTKDSRGNTQLRFQIKDFATGKVIDLHSKLSRISVEPRLLDYIEAHPALSYKVN